MPRIRITALSLIGCMDRKGYSISSGAYSEIETEISIPKDPRAFLEAAIKCLTIEEGSDEWREPVRQLGYDLVADKQGTGSITRRGTVPVRALETARPAVALKGFLGMAWVTNRFYLRGRRATDCQS
jgi:hypothetical protein